MIILPLLTADKIGHNPNNFYHSIIPKISILSRQHAGILELLLLSHFLHRITYFQWYYSCSWNITPSHIIQLAWEI